MDFAGIGVRIMEISHRVKRSKSCTEAQADAIALTGFLQEYAVVSSAAVQCFSICHWFR